MRRIGIFLGLLILVASPCHSQAPPLTLVQAEYPPFYFLDAQGNPTGFLVDYWKLWSEVTGTPLVFETTSWEEALRLMRTGAAHFTGGIIHTPARDEILDFSAAIVPAVYHLFHPSGTPPPDPASVLDRARFGVVTGDIMETLVRQRFPTAHPIFYARYTELPQAALSGAIDVFAAEDALVQSYLAKRETPASLVPLEQPLLRDHYRAAVRKGDRETLELINSGMARIPREEVQRLYARWTETAFPRPEGLVISCYHPYPPFSLLTPFVDIWRLWAAKTGQRIEFLFNDWEQSIQALSNGAADIHSGLYRTPEREAWLDFSRAFYENASFFYYRAGERSPPPPGSPAGEVVFGALKGAYSQRWLEENYPDAELRLFPTEPELIEAALKDEVDAFLGEKPVMDILLQTRGLTGQFTSGRQRMISQATYAGLLKGRRELLELVAAGFERMRIEELRAIEERWIKDPEARFYDRGGVLLSLDPAQRAWIEKHPVIRIGFDPHWPPVDFVDEQGRYQGIISDYIALVSRHLGLTFLPVVSPSWSEVFEYLDRGQIDIITGITNTPERARRMLFTEPHLDLPIVIITRADYPYIRGLADLEGKALAMPRDYASASWLKRDFPDYTFQEVDSLAQALMDVSTGRADAVVGAMGPCTYLMQSLGITNLKVAAPTPYRYELAIGVRKDWPELVEILNRALGAITPPERMAIYNKWVQVPVETGLPPGVLRTIVLRVIAVSGLLLALVLAWNWRLRREIGERKRAEAVMTRLAAAVEQAFEAITIMDPHFSIQYVNPAAEVIYGHKRREILGGNALALLRDRFFDPPISAIRARLETGEAWSGHLLYRRTNTDTCELEGTISPIRNAEGEVVNLVSIQRDMTHELELEKRLMQSQKMEAIGTLAGGIAHDFNNILSPIIGYAELLREECREDAHKLRFVDQILLAAERARDLVRHILTFSRQTEQVHQPLRIQPIVKESLKLLRASLPATIEIRESIDPACGPILSDPTQIHQIMMNLCTNAYHSMEEGGGVLSVCVTREKGEPPPAGDPSDVTTGALVRLAVQDTGAGIAPEVIDRIFDPYFTTKQPGKGTGLGLSVVHGIVEQSGGKIRLQSEPGEGSLFEVYFPELRGADTAAPVPPGEPERGSSEHVLLVDDEEAIIAMLEQTLTRLGYCVESCISGPEALEVFRADPQHFDLVITDMTMPHMTGDTLARAILALRPDIPVIMCTGFSEAITPQQARALGIREYIMKPVVRGELAAAIRRVLRRQAP